MNIFIHLIDIVKKFNAELRFFFFFIPITKIFNNMNFVKRLGKGVYSYFILSRYATHGVYYIFVECELLEFKEFYIIRVLRSPKKKKKV